MKLSVDRMLLKAKSHAKNGKITEAEELYRTVLSKFPGNKRAQQGLAALKASPKTKAHTAPAPEQVKALIALYNQGRLQEVVKQTNALVEQFPQAIVLFNILGAANAGLRRLDAAIESFNRALQIKPNNAEANYNLGKVLKDKGDLIAAIESYNRALQIKPDYAEAHNNLGVALKNKGDLTAAIESYNRALQIKPDYAEAHNNLGNALQEKGDLTAAIESFNRALQIKQDYREAHNNLGVALEEKGDPTAAIESYTRALQIKPDYAEAHSNLGGALKDKGDLTAAIESYTRALQIKPDFAECYRNYSTANKFKQDDPFIPKMKKLICAEGLSEKDLMHLSFALGKAEHDLGNKELGINHLIQGNALRKKELTYDISQDEQLFASIKQFFDSDAVNEQADFESDFTTTSIFILGMPRSGTTLVEQIVSSHSNVFGAGELYFLDQATNNSRWQVEKDRNQVLSSVRSFYNQKILEISDASIITDKMPLNFRWIGFILNALPEAKIVHLKRDPAAICWSNLKTYFPSKGMAFTFDGQDIANYYRLYEDLMIFWYQKYPDKIYNLNYEQLTENQEEETRKLFDYLELDWEDNVIEFHKNERSVRTTSNVQVRQEMYKGSSLEWIKYEQWLQPMLEILNT